MLETPEVGLLNSSQIIVANLTVFSNPQEHALNARAQGQGPGVEPCNGLWLGGHLVIIQQPCMPSPTRHRPEIGQELFRGLKPRFNRVGEVKAQPFPKETWESSLLLMPVVAFVRHLAQVILATSCLDVTTQCVLTRNIRGVIMLPVKGFSPVTRPALSGFAR